MRLLALALPLVLAASTFAQSTPQTAADLLNGSAASLGELQFDPAQAGDDEPETGNGGNGSGRRGRGCRSRCRRPQPRCVLNRRLPTVTTDCFTVTGRCLDLIDEVRFGRRELEKNGTIGGGSWRVADNGRRLEVCPPQCEDAGCYTVSMYRRGCRIARFRVRMFEPREPKIACDSRLRIGEEQCIYIHDGGQARPNNLFILISPDNIPSVAPGIVELEIGNNFTNYLCGVRLTGPCAEECIGQVPAAALGLRLYFQGVVFNDTGAVLPLPTTEVCSTRYID